MKIKSLTIVTHTGVKRYEVGENLNEIKIDEIKDVSIEWENGIDFMYQVIGNGKLVAEVINCPVGIEYFNEDGEPNETNG